MIPLPAPPVRSGAVLATRGAVRTPVVRLGRRLLRRGYALNRALHEAPDGERLITDPVFIMSPVRSGSTLLRAMLNTHTHICAPHELHLATMEVGARRSYGVDSEAALRMTDLDLANLLWDRYLHRLLVRSGKKIIVDKTPQNAAAWARIHEYWPDARYIHLRRHPGSIYDSLVNGTTLPVAQILASVTLYGQQLDAARAALPGPTVRYEDLTSDPEGTLRPICDYLGVRFQSRMLTYRTVTASAGLGDWSANIKSGKVLPARALPDLEDVPAALHPMIRSWGYDASVQE